MTETRFTWRWLFIVAGIGLVAGLVLGLILGWVIPLGGTGAVSVSALSTGSQNDYIVLVANSYAYDNDLPRARQRLGLLNDSKINQRVEVLAKALATRKDPAAANVADLAVALGSTDSSLQVLAASVSNNPSNGNDTSSSTDAQPTKFAMVDVPPTSTPKPTSAPTDTPTQAPTDAPTIAPTKAPRTAAPKNTAAAPAPTNTTAAPAPAAALAPNFLPDFPGGWWNGIGFVPASVAAGQQYWHLKSALFCDVADKRNNCPSLPGGGMDHSIYVGVLGADGSCASNINVKHLTNTGDTTPLEKKPAPYPWNSCSSDYEWNMYGEGNDIWVDGQGLASDKMTGLCLCNVIPPPGTTGILQGHAHVRYFLTFQLTTR